MSKNKKFMKALGVGAVATLGLFTFTGCSLSDSEKAKLMNELDNATEYMEETIDQLKEQNKKLKEQNNILQDYIEEIQNENAKITAEEAWNLIKIAKARHLTNYNGVRDNVRFTVIQPDDPEDMVVEHFQTENNGYVSLLTMAYEIEDEKYYQLVYENEGKIYMYNKSVVSEEISYTKSIISNSLNSEGHGLIENELNQFLPLDADASDIKFVEILENGNYKISFVFETIEENGKQGDDYYRMQKTVEIVDFVITKDCVIESISNNKTKEVLVQNKEDLNNQNGHTLQTFETILKVEYGVVEEDYINEILQEAISKDLKD